MIIVFEGDSITDTGRNTENGSLISIGQGYVVMVAGRLQSKYPGKIQAWNFGVSGDKIPNIYARMQPEVFSPKPDVLSILVGVNGVWHDLSWNGGVDAARYEKIYNLIVEEAMERVPGIKIMMMEPFILPGSATNPNYEKFRSEVDKRREIVKRTAEKYGQIFVPLQDMLDEAAAASDPKNYLGDGVHPTPAGHCLIADRWLEVFEKNITVE